MDFVRVLEDGRRDFLEASRELSAREAGARAEAGGWTVLECIEHAIAFEERHRRWIEEGTAVTPRRDSKKEMRLFTTIRNRMTKVETVDVLRPVGRWETAAAALAEFEAARDRTVQLVRERGEGLYSVGAMHPYFGTVNGAELIQLIDGHTRRHAEQIREARAGMGKAKAARGTAGQAKKAVVFRRDRPDLPEEMEEIEDAAGWFAGGEFATMQERVVRDASGTGLRAGAYRIEGSVLERVRLAGGEFGSAVWKDARFAGCDLANVRAHRMVLVRVELVDCRLTGISSAAVDWQDVLVRDGDLRYAQMQGGRFRNCEFEGCNWEEGDLQGADLTGSVLRRCQLGRADLRGAKLAGADLRGSEVEGMVVGVGDLRGAIVDAGQAMVLARLLGVEIR